MRRIVIMGATSGIGREIALQLIADGFYVGLAGRRLPLLKEIEAQWPAQVKCAEIDVTLADAPAKLEQLVEALGGMDCYLHVSGAGYYNPELDSQKEIHAVEVNAMGFTRMVDAAFNWFVAHRQPGHIAVVTSIAGTKGLGAEPAYSATKRFGNHYINALDQQARFRKLPITFTDIKPGFVDTDFLKGGHYPMLLKPEVVARKAIKAILSRKRRSVIDWRYGFLVAMWRLVPEWIWCRLRIK